MLRRTVVLIRRAQAPLARYGRQSSTRRELSFAEELMQHRKTQGKTIAARREDGAVAFPNFDAVDVDGTAVAFPALLKRRVTLVGVSFRAIGAAQSREWLEPFGRRVYLTYRGMAHTATAHCSLIEQPVFRFKFLRNWLLRDLRKAATDISLNTWNCLKIGDVAPIRQELGLDNRLVGYVYLLDQEGRVRFRGSGSPTEDELQLLFQVTEECVSERERVWTDVDEHAAEVTFDVDDGEDRDARLKRDRGFRARARDAQLPLELPVWEAGGDVPEPLPRVPWDVVGADGGPVAPPPRKREASRAARRAAGPLSTQTRPGRKRRRH
ncbi:unnamed protein product [Pelagomonas calceolata]|uniref:Uncharacterized protein n=1 Tax=Pelagomonas calceolata TaxID=35677 RepID=A0A8J2WUD7_9STRA|nr:unnamed protein product [Pelagomonas calceolata]